MNERDTGGFPENTMKKRMKQKAKESLLSVMTSFIPIRKTVIDIGASTGQYVRALREVGYECDGIDGAEGVESVTGGLVKSADLSKELNAPKRYDWGMFIEVGEHVPQEFEDTVIANVDRLAKEGLICSWALPGQRGRGHVNCRTSEYIASRFVELGWWIDDLGTVKARKMAGKWYENRIMILRR